MNDTTLMIFLPAIKAPMKHSEDEVNIAYSGPAISRKTRTIRVPVPAPSRSEL